VLHARTWPYAWFLLGFADWQKKASAARICFSFTSMQVGVVQIICRAHLVNRLSTGNSWREGKAKRQQCGRHQSRLRLDLSPLICPSPSHCCSNCSAKGSDSKFSGRLTLVSHTRRLGLHPGRPQETRTRPRKDPYHRPCLVTKLVADLSKVESPLHRGYPPAA
jgi:hypothetical protein